MILPMKKDRTTSNSSKIVGLAIALGLLIVFPFFLSAYAKDVFVLFTINVILMMSYRLITTMGGWSFAHIAVMGLGAYTMALLTTKYLAWSFWVALPLGGFVSALFALVTSYAVLRTKQFYFFLSSYAAGEALRQCFINFSGFFGGPDGIPFIERPTFLFGVDFVRTVNYYYLVLAIAIISGAILYRLDKCRIGATIKKVAVNESLSNSLGINTWGYKSTAFVIGSFFAGVAGVLFGNYNGFVAPSDFTTVFMFKIIASAIIGGTRTFAGPILGLVFLTLLQEIFREFQMWVPLIFGVCLIGILMFLPYGLERPLESMKRSLQKKMGLGLGMKASLKDQPSKDVV